MKDLCAIGLIMAPKALAVAGAAWLFSEGFGVGGTTLAIIALLMGPSRIKVD